MQLSYNSIYSIMLLCALFVVFINPTSAQIQRHLLGAKLLTEVEYEKLPKTNWELLKANADKQAIATKTSSIVMLNNPPIWRPRTTRFVCRMGYWLCSNKYSGLP